MTNKVQLKVKKRDSTTHKTPGQDPDSAWIKKARAELDQQAASIDAATQSRLTRARHNALSQLDKAKSPFSIGLWGTGLAVAASLVLAFTLWFDNNPAMGTLIDAELLTAQEEPEFFNDLEFYTWLAQQERAFDSNSQNTHEAGNVHDA